MACPGKSGGFQYCPDAVLRLRKSKHFTPVILYTTLCLISLLLVLFCLSANI